MAVSCRFNATTFCSGCLDGCARGKREEISRLEILVRDGIRDWSHKGSAPGVPHDKNRRKKLPLVTLEPGSHFCPCQFRDPVFGSDGRTPICMVTEQGLHEQIYWESNVVVRQGSDSI